MSRIDAAGSGESHYGWTEHFLIERQKFPERSEVTDTKFRQRVTEFNPAF
jgi:hypothetical protein